MNKQQLAAKIWESANKMRSKIEANEYKDYILGFIFYKYLSDKEVAYLKANYWDDKDLPLVTEDDSETVENLQDNIGYFIAYENLFSTWIAQGDDFKADQVTVALSSFDRLISDTYKRVFKDIFVTLQTGLSKLGESSGARTKAIRNLLYLIDDIPMNGKQDYDVLGFIYEYLIGNFAANAGKKAGEFYTPHEVSVLMSEIVAQHLSKRDEIQIYDPTSGSGSLLINIGKAVSKHMDKENNIQYYAQELKENTYNLTRMNLVMRGILPSNIKTRNADTLEEDWPYFEDGHPENYSTLYVDAVVSNPPYSQAWSPEGKDTDPRYARFGVAPKGKADYAFLLHDLYHLKPDGIMTIVLPHGVLFRGGEEGEIRKNLIEYNNIDAIIGLPANIFFGTGIPTIIMVLKQKKQNEDVLIIDASKGFAKVGKNNALRACDIKKIVDTVKSRATIEKYSKLVSLDEIRANDYNLNIPRYVDSSEKAESWDIYASMFGGLPEKELADFAAYWQAFPQLKQALFAADNDEYCHVCVADLAAAVQEHTSVQAFVANYAAKFHDLPDILNEELIGNIEKIIIAQEEEKLSELIFARLENVPLVDKYYAYQLLDDEWRKIAGDLEIIQTEGFDAAKQVDIRYIVKKENNKDVEVHAGYQGHVLPFELVQEYFLKDNLQMLKQLENRLSEITGEYESLLEELSEEDKEQNFVNENKDGFVPKEVKKALKAKEVEPATLTILKKYDELAVEEKALKKQLKADTLALELDTKAVLEALTDEEVRRLLRAKWIDKLVASLNVIPQTIVDDFVSRLKKLQEKYATTLNDVEEEIAETEQSLAAMLDELTGSEFDMQGLQELKKLLGGE